MTMSPFKEVGLFLTDLASGTVSFIHNLTARSRLKSLGVDNYENVTSMPEYQNVARFAEYGGLEGVDLHERLMSGEFTDVEFDQGKGFGTTLYDPTIPVPCKIKYMTMYGSYDSVATQRPTVVGNSGRSTMAAIKYGVAGAALAFIGATVAGEEKNPELATSVAAVFALVGARKSNLETINDVLAIRAENRHPNVPELALANIS